jgi:hypothetical protein
MRACIGLCHFNDKGDVVRVYLNSADNLLCCKTASEYVCNTLSKSLLRLTKVMTCHGTQVSTLCSFIVLEMAVDLLNKGCWMVYISTSLALASVRRHSVDNELYLNQRRRFHNFGCVHVSAYVTSTTKATLFVSIWIQPTKMSASCINCFSDCRCVGFHHVLVCVEWKPLDKTSNIIYVDAFNVV